MYDAMVFRETVSGADQPAVIRDFAEIWRAVERLCSRPRSRRWQARTDVERTFDPDAVRRVKETVGADTTIGVPS
jgi:hypothetical protein